MGKKIVPGSFVYDRYIQYKVSPDEEGILERFREVYKEQLSALFEEFLENEALFRMEEDYPALGQDIARSGLSTRTKRCLRAADICTVSDLVRYRPEELYIMRSIGKQSLDEIKQLVKSTGI